MPNKLRCVLTTEDLLGKVARAHGYKVMTPTQRDVFNLMQKASEDYREWKKNNPSELEIEVKKLEEWLKDYDENGIKLERDTLDDRDRT